MSDLTDRIDFDRNGRGGRFAAMCFGDRIGLALFLATLLFFTALWIVAWRISDTLTLLNTLHGMSDGHLYISTVKYGSIGATPGTHEVGGRMYGRNYGVLAVSLLPLAIIEGIGLVADLRIAIVALFSLGILALAVVVGRLLDRQRAAGLGGSLLALLVFVGNVAVATDLDPVKTELYALQVTHLLVGGFVVVLSYRLITAMHGRRAGLFAGTLVAVATPVGLWATIPKRHVFTAGIAVALAYALYQSRSRDREAPGSGLRYRLGAYAAIGLFAWVHAPEALLLLLVFAAVDIPTARNDLRSLASIAVVLFVAMIPFLVTNYLLSGSPVTPPRMLPQVGAGTGEPSFGGGGVGGGGTSGGLFAPILGVLDPMLSPLLTLLGLFAESLRNIVTQPNELVMTFLRSGPLEGYSGRMADYEAVNLSVLESAPLLAAILGVVPAAIRNVRARTGRGSVWPLSPERVVDAYLILFSIAFSLLYLARLPLHAQITVRYVLPVFPTLVLLVVRLPAIRRVLEEHWKLLLWSYAAAVLIGGQFVVVALAVLSPGVGEAFQFHAWIALGVALPLGIWSIAGRADGWWGRTGAVLIALAAGAVTVFLLLLTLEYFTVGNAQALPLVRAVAEIVSFS